MLKNSPTSPQFVHRHPIPHRKNATLMVAVRGCASPIERSLSRLRTTVIALKRILLCRCMTPPARIRTPKSGLTWLVDSPAFVRTGSSNATIRKSLGGPGSEYARLRERDLLTYHLRFPSPFIYRRADKGRNVSKCTTHVKGSSRPRWSSWLCGVDAAGALVARSRLRIAPASTSGTVSRGTASGTDHTRVCSQGSCRRTCNHSGQHKPS